MRRRRRLSGDHEDSTRWLVSYADLVTLLFAFFVVMYAMSSVNESKYRELSGSLENAFGKPPPAVPDARTSNAPLAGNPVVALQMRGVASRLESVLAPLLKGGQVRLKHDTRGLAIEINSQTLFAPGAATLAGDGAPILAEIAATLAGEPYDIEIAGHTDNQPIATASFPSNWELSAARASAVARALEAGGVAAPRLAAVGRAASRPIATNLTSEGRARNRRVELAVLATLPPAPVGAGR